MKTPFRTFIFCAMILTVTGCYAPAQSYPTLMPTPIVANIPQIMKRYEQYAFTVSLMPNDVCYAGVSFYNQQDKWTKTDLPTIKADASGICKWIWEVPSTAKNGIGEFRGYIVSNGQERNIYPVNFCIEVCQ